MIDGRELDSWTSLILTNFSPHGRVDKAFVSRIVGLGYEFGSLTGYTSD